jgi:putative membrane protein
MTNTRAGLPMAVLAAMLLALPAPGWARSAAADKSAAVGPQEFLKEAAMGGMAEVRLGNLAQQKAASDQVKQFGRRMVEDHSKVNDEVKALAKEKNITLPTTLDAKQQATYDRLSKLSGEEFDRAYMKQMLEDHREDVAAFRKEKESSDAAVKSLASKTLPTLEEHLALAERVDNQ